MSKIFEFIKIIQTTVIVYYGKQIKIKFQLYFDLYILLSFVGISMYDLIILMGLQIFCLDLCGRFEIFLSFILSTNFFFIIWYTNYNATYNFFSPLLYTSLQAVSFQMLLIVSNNMFIQVIFYISNQLCMWITTVYNYVFYVNRQLFITMFSIVVSE